MQSNLLILDEDLKIQGFFENTDFDFIKAELAPCVSNKNKVCKT